MCGKGVNVCTDDPSGNVRSGFRGHTKGELSPGRQPVRAFDEAAVLGQVDERQRGAGTKPGMQWRALPQHHDPGGSAAVVQNKATHWSADAR